MIIPIFIPFPSAEDRDANLKNSLKKEIYYALSLNEKEYEKYTKQKQKESCFSLIKLFFSSLLVLGMFWFVISLQKKTHYQLVNHTYIRLCMNNKTFQDCKENVPYK